MTDAITIVFEPVRHTFESDFNDSNDDLSSFSVTFRSVLVPSDVGFGRWAGTWTGARTYTTPDVVYYAGSFYVATQTGTNQNPSTQTAYWQSLSNRNFPSGSANDPAIRIGDTDTGLASLFANTLSIIPNTNMDLTDAEMHGFPLITERGGIVLGSVSTDGDNRFPNQAPLEIFIFNPASGAAVPLTIWQSGPDSAACEPVVMGRDRNPDRYGNTLAPAQAGDSLWTIQGQAGDSFNTANIAVGNIGMRVQSGTTPIEGNTRGFAGNFFVSLAAGDGVSAARTVMELQSDGDWNNPVGRYLINNSVVITTEEYGRFKGLLSHWRSAISDDAIAVIPVPGGTTAFVMGIMTGHAATSPPLFFSCRVDSSASIDNHSASALQANVVYTTGAITDHLTCTDGKITISAHTDGNLYICNRLGGPRTEGLHFYLNKNTP